MDDVWRPMGLFENPKRESVAWEEIYKSFMEQTGLGDLV